MVMMSLSALKWAHMRRSAKARPSPEPSARDVHNSTVGNDSGTFSVTGLAILYKQAGDYSQVSRQTAQFLEVQS